MKYFKGQYYVEVKDHRYKIHPTENTISLRTQYQVRNQTHIRKKSESHQKW